MSTAFWILFGVVALLSALLLRVCVRVLAKGADNGWDNAFGYIGAISALVYFPIRWIVGAHSIPLLFLIPPLVLLTQIFSLRVIYEVSNKRAFVVGVAHTIVGSLFFGAITFAIGVVAAYIMYGKIISDPLLLLKIICRLIGVPYPFDGF